MISVVLICLVARARGILMLGSIRIIDGTLGGVRALCYSRFNYCVDNVVIELETVKDTC